MNWEPGRESLDLAKSSAAGRDMDTRVDVGKYAPTSSLPARTSIGDPNIDKGPGCVADPSAAGCFLDPITRSKLIESFHGRVSSLEMNYLAALTDLRMDELAKRDDNDGGWLLGLIISLAAGYLTTLGGAGARILAALNTAERDNLVKSLGPTRPIAAAFTVEKHIDAVMSNLAGTVRAYAIPAAGKVTSDAAGKTQHHNRTVSFLDQLKSHASSFYQHVREDTPTQSNDEVLLSIWRGLDADQPYNKVEWIKQQISEKIERFKQSKASWIGTREGSLTPKGDILEQMSPELQNAAAHSPVPIAGQHVKLTTRVVWLTYLSQHGVPRLCYFDDRKYFQRRLPVMEQLTDAMDGSPFGFNPIHGIERSVEIIGGKPNGDHIPEDWDFVATVEPEFVDVAIDRHVAAFGERPKALIFDDRNPQHIRVVVDPFDGKGGDVPKVQLGPKPRATQPGTQP